MSESTRTQVLIVGGGMIGLSFAAALGQAGIDAVAIDRDSPEARTDPGYDIRTTAISYGNRRLLEGLGIWPALEPEAAPILDIRIADGNAPVFLHYDHTEVGDEPFGHIVENRTIRRAMLAALDAAPTVAHRAPAALAALETAPAGITARLSDGRRITADLVVGADGRGSLVRRLAGIGTTGWAYRQKAIVCAIAHEVPHDGVAVEHFYPDGPFAILPMRDDEHGTPRSSIVWTVPERRADAFLRLPENDFSDELQRRAGDFLGRVRWIGSRAAWPLGVLHAERYTADRVALIGDAAHAIHPIAGQGLNLGMRDVASLAEILADSARLGLDLGWPDGLARYQRWRRADVLSLIAVTDGLNRLFSNDLPPVRVARDIGLAAVGRLPPLKRFFMRHAMGTVGQLPRLLRGESL